MAGTAKSNLSVHVAGDQDLRHKLTEVPAVPKKSQQKRFNHQAVSYQLKREKIILKPTQFRNFLQEGNGAMHQVDLNKRRQKQQIKFHIRAIDFDKQQDTFQDDERLLQFITKCFNMSLQQFV